MEQDFEQFLLTHSEYLTDNPDEADFQWFQPYWNRYYCNHWGSNESVGVLRAEILNLVSRNIPTFTICEYDIVDMQPSIDLCDMIVFTASRHSDNGCIDIPLLCSPHRELPYKKNRKWLASFMGKFETHGVREEMRQALQNRDDVYISKSKDTQAYIELMADSYIALAPRGYGGQTFRFYEAMQFGCVPMLIGDIDTRPFKRWIEWWEFSAYSSRGDIDATLSMAKAGIDLTKEMGQRARQVWQNELHYGKWCKYVLKELEDLK